MRKVALMHERLYSFVGRFNHHQLDGANSDRGDGKQKCTFHLVSNWPAITANSRNLLFFASFNRTCRYIFIECSPISADRTCLESITPIICRHCRNNSFRRFGYLLGVLNEQLGHAKSLALTSRASGDRIDGGYYIEYFDSEGTPPPRRRQRNSATALRRLLSTSSPALGAIRSIPTAVCSTSD